MNTVEEFAIENRRRMKAVYELIVEHADAGTVLPNYVEVAGLCDIPNKDAVTRTVKQLEQDGKIKLIGRAWQRQVKVMASGRVTAHRSKYEITRGIVTAKRVFKPDVDVVESAKLILRRSGFKPVYNAELVHPQNKRCKGKFNVSGKLVSLKELVLLAERYKARSV